MPHCIAIRHIECEDLGVLAAPLQARGIGVTYVDMTGTAPAPAALEAVADADFVISLGGPMAVYESERYPFLERELELLRGRLEARRPTLGLCLGSQLLAAAVGARVYPSGRREIGWYPIEFTHEAAAHTVVGRLIPSATGEAGPAGIFFHWHGDTFELPAEAHLIGASGRCAHQGFWLAERGAAPHAIALQFHAEVDAAALERWLAVYGPEAESGDLRPGDGVMGLAELRAGAQTHGPALARRSGDFLLSWLDALESQTTAR